jgi:hypothetical protein
LDDELDIQDPGDDDAAFVWLTAAVQDILANERPRPGSETIALAPSTTAVRVGSITSTAF